MRKPLWALWYINTLKLNYVHIHIGLLLTFQQLNILIFVISGTKIVTSLIAGHGWQWMKLNEIQNKNRSVLRTFAMSDYR